MCVCMYVTYIYMCVLGCNVKFFLTMDESRDMNVTIVGVGSQRILPARGVAWSDCSARQVALRPGLQGAEVGRW